MQVDTAFLTVAETTGDAVILADDKGVVSYLNPAARRLFGYEADEAVGKSVTILLPARFHEAYRRGLRRILDGGEAPSMSRPIELSGRAKDGKEIALEVSVSVCRTVTETMFVGFIRSVEERKQSEMLLREREEKLRQDHTMQAVGKLAGGVAHEFNNLMTAVMGYADILAGELPAGSRHRGIAEEISKAAETASGLTRQLLAYGRRQVLRPRVVDLNELVRSIENTLHSQAGPGVRLQLQLDPALGMVQADPNQVQQILLNLVTNARDAMPRGGALTIQTRNAVSGEDPNPAPQVLLAVSDEGSGMSPEVQAHLFEPFFTTKDMGKGTGLGLATVYGIVQQSGGRIHVRSEIGKGSTFSVALPRVGPLPGDRSPDGGGAPATRKETILLVEDSDLIRRMVQDALAREGYLVLTAASGREALRVSLDHSGPIHLLVTDVVMPEMGGPELATRLGPVRPNLRVLFISGYTSGALGMDGMLEPGTELLEKPFTPKDLCRRIREILDRPGSPQASGTL